MTIKAPFPWFGGKSRAAELVWSRFGDVPNYVEPFAGSLAVLLARPTPPNTETVNDADHYLSNFWRAISRDPEQTARHADWPVNEADLLARHRWLLAAGVELKQKLRTDPDYCDFKAAGWWVWGVCIWIGSGWCDNDAEQLPHLGNAGMGINRKLPHLGDAGMGINRKLPHLGDAGKGINRKLPHLGNAGTGINRKLPHLGDAGKGIAAYFEQLADRLRRVRVACGDWSRVVTPSVTEKHGITGVLLDPPYTEGDMQYSAGGCGGELANSVRDWAVANGDNPLLRIALCGYDGEHTMPPTWEQAFWKACKGYQASESALADRKRECIWFSPACLKPQPELFSV